MGDELLQSGASCCWGEVELVVASLYSMYSLDHPTSAHKIVATILRHLLVQWHAANHGNSVCECCGVEKLGRREDGPDSDINSGPLFTDSTSNNYL